jgi:hypothetical protein
MVQIVRKRTLTRMNTMKSELDTAQIKEDASPDSKHSEMIKKYVLDYDSNKNSSQIRASRSNSLVKSISEEKIGEGSPKDSRKQYLENLQGSFSSANSASIESWGKSEEDNDEELPLS